MITREKKIRQKRIKTRNDEIQLLEEEQFDLKVKFLGITIYRLKNDYGCEYNETSAPEKRIGLT